MSSTLASSLPKYHFTVHSSPVKDGHVDPRREGNFGGPLRRERAAAARRVLTSFVRATAICVREAKATQTADVASQVAAVASALGISTGESGTTAVRSAAAALALMEAALIHAKAVHA